MKKIPGQRSNIALISASALTISTIFIMIVGHLSIIFFIYGKITASDSFAELALFLPWLSSTALTTLAILAIAIDIWIIFSMQQERKTRLKR